MPARARAHCRYVVSIDMDSVPADLFRGERHRVGLGNQILRAEIDHRAVFAETRTDQHARVWRAVERDAGLE